uniref:Uncharacterized protein n=1 Tax=Setaria italica TaxID=4555 RepID=K3Z077_SETIT
MDECIVGHNICMKPLIIDQILGYRKLPVHAKTLNQNVIRTCVWYDTFLDHVYQELQNS